MHSAHRGNDRVVGTSFPAETYEQPTEALWASNSSSAAVTCDIAASNPRAGRVWTNDNVGGCHRGDGVASGFEVEFVDDLDGPHYEVGQTVKIISGTAA